MHVLVYEWITGGGLLSHPGSLPESLLVEGLAMVQAVAEDFLTIDDCRVTVLQDPRVVQLAARGAELLPVSSMAEHNASLEQLCREADAVLLIAPEIDDALSKIIAQAEAVGAKLISPGTPFVTIASDKQRTAQQLGEAGVPTPRGVVVAPDDILPREFPYPAVIKPLDGAGSQDVYVVTGPYDHPPAYVADRRLEEFTPGVAASVAVLTGPGQTVPLPPCQQRLSTDGRLRYLGGETPLAPGLAKRAQALAVAAVNALPDACGYVGVDLILGSHPDGADDRVIELNPRITTSYTALRHVVKPSLAAALIGVAHGESAAIDFDTRPIEFGVDGRMSYLQ